MTQTELALTERKRNQPLYPRADQIQLWTLIRAFQRGARLTVLLAIERYGIYALSQRCGELRKLGWPIQSEMTELPNGKNVKEYWL